MIWRLIARFCSTRIARPESGRGPVTVHNPHFAGQNFEYLSMYAVIESGGKQHRVEPGEVLRLEKLDIAEGDTVDFENVMMIGEGEKVSIGTPYVEGGK